MLFGNADVKIAGGIFVPEGIQPRPFRHGGRNGGDRRVFFCQRQQCLGEGLRKRHAAGFAQRVARFHIKNADSVELGRFFLSGFVALAFFGDHVKHHRAFDVL